MGGHSAFALDNPDNALESRVGLTSVALREAMETASGLFPERNHGMVSAVGRDDTLEKPWYYEVYYECLGADGSATDFVRYKRGQGWAQPESRVSINPEDIDGTSMEWLDPWGEPEQYGIHYVFDEANPENRLSAHTGEATSDNPLKIYYKLAPARLTYKYDRTAPAQAVVPDVVESGYSKVEPLMRPQDIPGYHFEGWRMQQEKGRPDVAIEDDRVVMPYWDITVVGSWSKVPEPVREPVRIVPADMTIYMGGDEGYDGVVDETGATVSGCLIPDPAVRIKLPEQLSGVDPTELELVSEVASIDASAWKFEKYASGHHDVYRMVTSTGANQRPVRVRLVDDNGNVVVDDAVDLKKHVNRQLSMSIYAEGISDGKVYVRCRGEKYPVNFDKATLSIRGTTQNVVYDSLFDDILQKPDVPHAEASDGTVFFLNGGRVEADQGGSDIVLIFDDIIGDAADARLEALRERGDAFLNADGNSSDYEYEFKYLDVVDRLNANILVTPSKPLCVSWPIPNEAAGKKVHVLHYRDLHRDEGDGSVDAIAACEVEELPAKIEGGFITFETSEFSPFALAWESDEAPMDPAPEPPADQHPGSHDDSGSTPDSDSSLPTVPGDALGSDATGEGSKGDSLPSGTEGGEVKLPTTGDSRLLVTAFIGVLAIAGVSMGSALRCRR